MSLTLDEYAGSLVQEVIAFCEADSISTHDAFTEHVLSSLETAGQIVDWSIVYYRSRGIEISGYGVNDDQGTLDIFITQFRQQPLQVKIGKAELTALAKRALGFVSKANEGLSAQLEAATEAHDAALTAAEALKTVTGIRIFVITNDVSTVRTIGALPTIGDLPVTTEIWDLQRLHRLETSGVLHEPIAVTFDDPLPCLSTPHTDENYSVFLSIIRGDVLAEIYQDYGTRLLELNVRSFLQLKGAVNRGIRETLIHMPERFLAYNNGISATASKVEWRDLGGGTSGIRRIHDLQIVNGGQTTASIHSSFAKKEADLTKVFVQMKLTVVEPTHLQEVVPEISRFSNTQNKVTVVDFSSNDPYHVELEKLTRTLWAPAVAGSGQETKWFYERARGQYAEALSRERTPARQRAFKLQFPLRQKFLKTDVAKWENSYGPNPKPWLVSRGAEKNFRAFMAELDGATPTSDAEYVRRLMAKGILFRAAEKVVTQQAFGGYRANIVTYSIAKLAQATNARLDLDQIWRDQYVTDATLDALAEISMIVNKVITQPSGTANVGEWTKKEACWARVAEVEWSSPLLAGELSAGKQSKSKQQRTRENSATGAADALARVLAIPGKSWFDLSQWARETNSLTPFHRSLAYSLGRLAKAGTAPSDKQAKHGVAIIEAAQQLGFLLESTVSAPISEEARLSGGDADVDTVAAREATESAINPHAGAQAPRAVETPGVRSPRVDLAKTRPEFDDWAVNNEAELALAFGVHDCEELAVLLSERVSLPCVIDEIDEVSITLHIRDDFGRAFWFPFRAHVLWDELCEMAAEAYAWDTWDRIEEQVWQVEGIRVTVEHHDRAAWADPSYAELSFDYSTPAPADWSVDEWLSVRFAGPLSGFKVTVRSPDGKKVPGRGSLETIRASWARTHGGELSQS